MKNKRKIATIALQNNVNTGKIPFTGQDIIQNAKVFNVYLNTNTTISSGTAYTGDFELTIVDKSNTAVFDRIPSNAIQRDANSQQFIPIEFEAISLDKSFIQCLTLDTNWVQLMFEYEEMPKGT